MPIVEALILVQNRVEKLRVSLYLNFVFSADRIHLQNLSNSLETRRASTWPDRINHANNCRWSNGNFIRS